MTLAAFLGRLVSKGYTSRLWVVFAPSGENYYLDRENYTAQEAIEKAQEWDSIKLLGVTNTYYNWNGDGGTNSTAINTSRGVYEVGDSYSWNRKFSYGVSPFFPVKMAGMLSDELWALSEGHGLNEVSITSFPRGMKGRLFSMMDYNLDEPKPVDAIFVEKVHFGAGIYDYTYTGPRGSLFFRDRGRTGSSASNSSWYSLNQGFQILAELSEDECRAMVA